LKYCEFCRKHYQNEYFFCPDCGGKLNQNSKNENPAEGINLGDDNVVAGDIIGEVNDYNIQGNATFIKNEDESKRIIECSICGKQCFPVSGYICKGCSNFVCADHFNTKYLRCNSCLEKNGMSQSPHESLSILEKSILNSAETNYYSINGEEMYKSLSTLMRKHPDNPYVKMLYSEYAASFAPDRIADTDPYQISTARELGAVVDANIRLKQFAKADDLLKKIDLNNSDLAEVTAFESAGIFIDMYNYNNDEKALEHARNILNPLAGFSDNLYYRFLSDYLVWSTSGSLLKILVKKDSSKDFLHSLYRRRRNLSRILPYNKSRQLKAAYVEIPSQSLLVPLYFTEMIGRESGFLSSALITDDACSRMHAVIEVQPDMSLKLNDAGSTNGTFINGNLLTADKKVKLKVNDKITVGETDIYIRDVIK